VESTVLTETVYASCGTVDRSGDRVGDRGAGHTGPGLLESVYELCLCRELADAGIAFARQVTIPVLYKGAEVGDGFKADIVVAGELILEIKAVSSIVPIHEVQLRTYLRMSGVHVGLLLYFNVPCLVDGLRRYVV
jgi:GxxExxY protein